LTGGLGHPFTKAITKIRFSNTTEQNLSEEYGSDTDEQQQSGEEYGEADYRSRRRSRRSHARQRPYGSVPARGFRRNRRISEEYDPETNWRLEPEQPELRPQATQDPTQRAAPAA